MAIDKFVAEINLGEVAEEAEVVVVEIVTTEMIQMDLLTMLWLILPKVIKHFMRVIPKHGISPLKME